MPPIKSLFAAPGGNIIVYNIYLTAEFGHLDTAMQKYHNWLKPIDCNDLPSGPAYYIGNGRYDYGPDHLTWDEARNYCRGRGGDLAVTGMDSLATRE